MYASTVCELLLGQNFVKFKTKEIHISHLLSVCRTMSFSIIFQLFVTNTYTKSSL